MDSQLRGDAARQWNGLHAQPRFRPRYPSEHVVRFLMSRYPESLRASGTLTALDIGVGAGRHTRLLCESGFTATGVDTSLVGLRHTRESLAPAGYQPALVLASMVALPFPADLFDAAISFGVFYTWRINHHAPGYRRAAPGPEAGWLGSCGRANR